MNLHREGLVRDLALFDLAIDSKIRGCDLVRLRIGDLVVNAAPRNRAMIVQQKTGKRQRRPRRSAWRSPHPMQMADCRAPKIERSRRRAAVPAIGEESGDAGPHAGSGDKSCQAH